MSDPATTIHQITEEQFQEMIGRRLALELLVGQLLVFLIADVDDESREEFNLNLLVGLEGNFDRMTPTASREALKTAENLLASALQFVRKTMPREEF